MRQSYESKKNFPKIASHKKAVKPNSFLLVFIKLTHFLCLHISFYSNWNRKILPVFYCTYMSFLIMTLKHTLSQYTIHSYIAIWLGTKDTASVIYKYCMNRYTNLTVLHAIDTAIILLPDCLYIQNWYTQNQKRWCVYKFGFHVVVFHAIGTLRTRELLSTNLGANWTWSPPLRRNPCSGEHNCLQIMYLVWSIIVLFSLVLFE